MLILLVFVVNAAVSDVTHIENSHYEGNVMTDAYIAMNKMTDNFDYLQMQNLDDGKLMKWVIHDEELSLDDIGSTTGEAYGIAVWKDNVNLDGDIINANINA